MKAALELSSKPNRNGLFEIYVRIQDGAKKKRIKANVAVEKKQFKSKNHNLKWISNHPNQHSINSDLKALIESYDDVLFVNSTLTDRYALQNVFKDIGGNVPVGKEINGVPRLTPELVIHSVKKSSISQAFVPFWVHKMTQMRNYNNQKGYQQALNKWEAFTELKNLGNLDFKQVTESIIIDFENYLIVTKKLQASTAYTDIKKIRSLYNMAVKEKIIPRSDYMWEEYTLPKFKTKKKERLSIDELKEFTKVKYEKGSLIKTAQQAFLLAVNMAGVRIEDILTLRWTYVRNGRINYNMYKTGSNVSIEITPKIKSILDYFKSIATDGMYILPILKDGIEDEISKEYKKEIGRKTALINKYLKKIATDASIDKTISTHISRHTFASIAAKKTKGNIQFLQSALRHSDSKITQGYLRDLDEESLDAGMRMAMDI